MESPILGEEKASRSVRADLGSIMRKLLTRDIAELRAIYLQPPTKGIILDFLFQVMRFFSLGRHWVRGIVVCWGVRTAAAGGVRANRTRRFTAPRIGTAGRPTPHPPTMSTAALPATWADTQPCHGCPPGPWQSSSMTARPRPTEGSATTQTTRSSILTQGEQLAADTARLAASGDGALPPPRSVVFFCSLCCWLCLSGSLLGNSPSRHWPVALKFG